MFSLSAITARSLWLYIVTLHSPSLLCGLNKRAYASAPKWIKVWGHSDLESPPQTNIDLIGFRSHFLLLPLFSFSLSRTEANLTKLS